MNPRYPVIETVDPSTQPAAKSFLNLVRTLADHCPLLSLNLLGVELENPFAIDDPDN